MIEGDEKIYLALCPESDLKINAMQVNPIGDTASITIVGERVYGLTIQNRTPPPLT